MRPDHPLHRPSLRLLCAALLLAGCCGAAGAADELPAELVRLNFSAGNVFTAAFIDSAIACDKGLPIPVRIGAWARRFAAAPGIDYLFGGAEGGYVAEGRLELDAHQDCVSLVYRCSELARAADAVDALSVALAVRFAGADPDSVIAADGRVDYDRPEHLDYSLDMIRAGRWGMDVTGCLAGAVTDTTGSARVPAGSFRYVPTDALREADLVEGDIVWLVLDPADPGGRRLREEFGLVIGHLGVVIREQRRAMLVHAASRPLPGWYDAGGVVQVPLTEYLARVEKFCGVMVTRFP